MLFNSFAFLLGFLPAAFALHWAVDRWRPDWRLPLLAVLSLLFYAYWDWRFLPLMVGSIWVNWLAAEQVHRHGRMKVIPWMIALNIAVLCLFKYTNFFAETFAGLGAPQAHFEIALPLGISFFTFHHVMYLMDLRRTGAPRFTLIEYTLYIAFFPQVLAGPLVRWKEIMHQFAERPYMRPDVMARFGMGLALIAIGLVKKVFLGDPLAGDVNPVFAAAAQGKAPTFLEAWQATLGFSFQVYMDFSGYTDMAIGLGLLFGVLLPQNFDAPFRATNLAELWRRWHMTLSRFLRDYLYVTLGGSRNGVPIQIFALFATMALGGLWHGAAWTMVVWGMMHGVALGVCILWQRANLPMPMLLGWLLTFMFFVLSLVVFRATSFHAAGLMFQGLFGFTEFGDAMRWQNVAASFVVAMVGPTAWVAVQRMPAHPLVAVAIGVAIALCLFKIGEGGGYEFIYFQF